MLPDRRSFCATLGVALAGYASGAHRLPSAHAAGVGPLGIQLYTVRDAMKQDFAGTLARIAKLGYAEVEFAGYFDHDPREVRRILDRHKLRAPSAHIPLDQLTGDRLARTLDAAHVVGHQWVVVPFLAPEARGTTADAWRQLAARLDAIGTQVHAAGLRLAYHNHDFELAPVEGAVPLELLIAGTNPSRVDFEMDVYWVTKAGNNPLDWFARHPGRFAMLHLKDATAAPERKMADVGSGTIDFRPILARRREAGVKHLFVERDDAPEPFASAKASHDYLARFTV